MTKKIEEIKEEMGFRKIAPMCCNCKHFLKDQSVITGWDGREYPIEKN